MLSDSETPYCRDGARHWFTYYGLVGSSAPTCQRCGIRNPHYDPDRDDKLHDPHHAARATTIHMIPPIGSGLTACCKRTPFEISRTDRITSDPARVTCLGTKGTTS